MNPHLPSTPEEIGERSQRFRMIFEHSRDALFLLNPSENKILDASPSACDLLGYGREELKGMPVSEIHPNEMDELMSFAQQAAQDGGATTSELTCLTKSGNVIPSEISATFYREENLDRSIMIAQVRDVSERVAAEKAQRELEETLNHSQKMEAIGQLAGGIAHDFNNLLTVINCYSEELLNRDDMAAGKEELEAIRLAGQRGADLTRQLLTFSRKEDTQPCIVDIHESIRKTEQMWRRVISEDIELIVNLCAEDCHIFIDRGQLDQVLTNLVVNARDAMPGGGRITMDIEVEESATAVPSLSAPCVKFAVSDNGIGMDEATQARIFEPFFTTKEVGKGTGLGLATAYAIIEKNGGNLSVASAEGEGTCFTIHLPLSDDKPVKDELEVEKSKPINQSDTAATILVVEDEFAVRKLVVKSLERVGYDVLEADNGVTGAEFVATYSGDIDLLISDVVMPKAGGEVMAEAFLAQHEEGAVLFMSGYADGKDVGAEIIRHQPILGKPFNQLELLDATAQKLSQRD